MYYNVFAHVNFWLFLLKADEVIADLAQEKGCPYCDGKLHVANYPRNPTGAKNLPPGYQLRFSFCCDQGNCRKRATPPSVRFLGRKVYLAAIVVVVAAMKHGSTPDRLNKIYDLFHVDLQTVLRWSKFWRELFPQTQFWKLAKHRLMSTAGGLPHCLLDAFFKDTTDPFKDWLRLLTFISPITTKIPLEFTDTFWVEFSRRTQSITRPSSL